MSRIRGAVCVVMLATGCGDDRAAPVDAAPHDSIESGRDAPMIDPPPIDAPQLVRVSGNVDFNGGLAGVTMTVLGNAPQTTTTDAQGDFHFDVPENSRLIMKATPPAQMGLFPMIRGVVAHDDLRPRVFYLLGPPEVAAASGLGLTFDPAKAIVEVDFRNASIGGYSFSLDAAGGGLIAGFGIAIDGTGNPQQSFSTLVGGNGSTLLYGGLVSTDATFTAQVPAGATLPCQPRDANPLPLMAGVVTWFDYECGNATD